MEKMFWVALAVLWTVVWSAAVYAAPGDQMQVHASPIALTAAAAVPVVDTRMTPANTLLPTQVLDGANSTEAIGLVLGSMLGLRYVSRRRPI